MLFVFLHKLMMDVNYMGVVRITRGLLPSLRAYARSRHTVPEGSKHPRARLITITSMAARLSLPGHGGYCASKHAAKSFLDTLRIELSPCEIDVSMIEPFYAKTPMMANSSSSIENGWAQANAETKLLYGPQFLNGIKSQFHQSYKDGMPSKWVVDASVKAICQKQPPKASIIVGFWNMILLFRVQEVLPGWMVDGASRSKMKKNGSWPADPLLLNANHQ
jgi:NAD(P)-dependent dehydrogenase (short-subunit alcohol dehydrogenase family)